MGNYFLDILYSEHMRGKKKKSPELTNWVEICFPNDAFALSVCYPMPIKRIFINAFYYMSKK